MRLNSYADFDKHAKVQVNEMNVIIEHCTWFAILPVKDFRNIQKKVFANWLHNFRGQILISQLNVRTNRLRTEKISIEFLVSAEARER